MQSSLNRALSAYYHNRTDPGPYLSALIAGDIPAAIAATEDKSLADMAPDFWDYIQEYADERYWDHAAHGSRNNVKNWLEPVEMEKAA